MCKGHALQHRALRTATDAPGDVYCRGGKLRCIAVQHVRKYRRDLVAQSVITHLLDEPVSIGFEKGPKGTFDQRVLEVALALPGLVGACGGRRERGLFIIVAVFESPAVVVGFDGRSEVEESRSGDRISSQLGRYSNIYVMSNEFGLHPKSRY